MKKKIKRTPFYQKIAIAILEKMTFSIMDMEGADKIYYPIAKFMLRDEPEQNLYILINGYAEAIEKNLSHAIAWLEEKGTPVYRKVEEGTRNIQAISIEAEFKTFDFKRIEQRMRREIGANIISIKRKHPESLQIAQQRVLLEALK